MIGQNCESQVSSHGTVPESKRKSKRSRQLQAENEAISGLESTELLKHLLKTPAAAHSEGSQSKKNPRRRSAAKKTTTKRESLLTLKCSTIALLPSVSHYGGGLDSSFLQVPDNSSPIPEETVSQSDQFDKTDRQFRSTRSASSVWLQKSASASHGTIMDPSAEDKIECDDLPQCASPRVSYREAFQRLSSEDSCSPNNEGAVLFLSDDEDLPPLPRELLENETMDRILAEAQKSLCLQSSSPEADTCGGGGVKEYTELQTSKSLRVASGYNPADAGTSGFRNISSSSSISHSSCRPTAIVDQKCDSSGGASVTTRKVSIGGARKKQSPARNDTTDDDDDCIYDKSDNDDDEMIMVPTGMYLRK